MAIVTMSGALAKFAGGKEKVEVPGKNVLEILLKMKTDYPGIEKYLFNEGENLNKYINIFVDKKNIRIAGGLQTKLDAKSEVVILVALAGG